MNDKIRIFLADDHKILRESLRILLSQEADIEVAGEAEDGLSVEKRSQENSRGYPDPGYFHAEAERPRRGEEHDKTISGSEDHLPHHA